MTVHSFPDPFNAASRGRPGSTGCGHGPCPVEVWNGVHVDISSGTRIGKRARFGNARAIIRRGEPVQLQLWARIACNRAEAPVVGSGHGRLTNGVMMDECR